MYFLCGNWKMNFTTAEAEEFAKNFAPKVADSNVKIGIAAPFTALSTLAGLLKDTNINLYAQNVHFEENGTYTGEISAKMLADLEIAGTIIGHSERRAQFNETDELVNKKVKAALKYGLQPIICIGETIEERASGKFEEVIKRMIIGAFDGISTGDAQKCVVAYEPVWAISKGAVQSGANSLVATPEIADDTCEIVRNTVKSLYGDAIANNMIIQYGGSMSPENVNDLLAMPNIDGGLIGGASLKPDMFAELINKAS